jgi:eukaryotic-like serine/threonine-protein kinase
MPRAPDLSGRALDGRYELLAVIGEGTFGRVYSGLDRRLARPVAVKVIKPWWAEDPVWVRSFEREAQLLARVHDPGIVQIFDVGHADEGLYYVAELVDGESLATRLRRGPIPARQAREIAEQLCRALTPAHDQRVVHRDIKPANVLISADGRVKVADFGVARLAEGSTDGGAATIVGTPRYMAPEQARGRPTSPATDVYAIGIVLYEMLSGQPPFVEKSAVELALRHLHDHPPPLAAGTPAALVAIVDRALAKDPAARYADGAAMAAALAAARAPVSAPRRSGNAPVPALAPRAVGTTATLAPPPVPTAATRVGSPDRTAATPDAPPDGTAATHVRAPAETAATHVRAPAETAATRVAPPDGTAATRVQPPMAPRRHVNLTARRRRRIAAAGVVLLLAAIAAGAYLIAAGNRVTVPDLRGLSRSRITAALRGPNLHATFGTRFSAAPRGIAVAQSPAPGTRVDGGATVLAVLSAGPAPVTVPRVIGEGSSAAQAQLAGLGLRVGVVQVPAAGVATGVVANQAPSAGAVVPRRSAVQVSVAEAPRWRPLTSFAGDSGGSSVPFRIRGRQWRVRYSMGYEGTCTLIFICSGPNAQVANLSGGENPGQFDLGEGSGQEKVFGTGPGIYQLTVTPGSDTARWAITVEDYY